MVLLWSLLLLLVTAVTHTDASGMCPRLTLDNGRVKLRSGNRVAKFRCRRNFLMIEGDRFVTCQLGIWRGNIPKCIGSGCDGHFDIPHGRFLLGFGDALAQFECDPGYQLVGSGALSCNSRRWNDTTPACLAPQHTLYDCNFETADLCTWSREPGGDGEPMWWLWSLSPPAVQASGTRPREDHTYGNTSGHYLYVDGSASGVVRDSTARLYSPVLQPLTISPSCATLWVAIRGPNTGELNIYLKPASEDLDVQAAEVTITGHQPGSGAWRLVYISLQDMDEPFQVVVEAVWGDGYMSDIAVDDFLASSGSRCIELELEYIKQTMDDGGNGTDSDNAGTPPASMIPITTPLPMTLVTVPTTAPPTTLPERTSKPPLTMPATAITTTTTTTTTTTKTTTTTTPRPTSQPNAVTPPPFVPTKVPSTTTTGVMYSSPMTTRRATTTTAPTTTRRTTTATITSRTTSPTTTKRITTTGKPFTTTRTTVKTTETTTDSTQKTTAVRPKKTTITENMAVTTDSSNEMPIPNKVQSPEQKKSFFTLLTVLLVSLGVAFLAIFVIVVYKRCDGLRQQHLSDDSDVKYLQQGDDDSNGVGDSDSMIYHPRNRSANLGNLESSASTSVASSLASTNSGSSSAPSRKPVRPPPPVPPAMFADFQHSTGYSTLPSSSSVEYKWPESSEDLADVLLSDPSMEPAGIAPLTGLPAPQSDLLGSLPPPVPPRAHGAGTAV